MRTIWRAVLTSGITLAIPIGVLVGQGGDKNAVIKAALSAAPPELAANASVQDWDGNVLKRGSNGFTCLPTPPGVPGNAPMCLDAVWLEWAKAWESKTAPMLSGTGTGYMLAGDAGASNTDPFAHEDTGDNDWVVSGPHVMVIVPDPKVLDNVTTDYTKGVPWVMWKGTPYAHIMVPLGKHTGH
jgi:hypothetical protein